MVVWSICYGFECDWRRVRGGWRVLKGWVVDAVYRRATEEAQLRIV